MSLHNQKIKKDKNSTAINMKPKYKLQCGDKNFTANPM